MQGYAILYIYQEKGYTMQIIGFYDIRDTRTEDEEGFEWDFVYMLCNKHAEQALEREDIPAKYLGDEFSGTCDGCNHD